MLTSTLYEILIIWFPVVCCLAIFLVRRVLWPTVLGLREPPTLRPKIPLIGHLIDLIQMGYNQHVKNQ
ncbi:hypothetical protein BDP55DRAFT_677728 [Colletotrichum godetiae]|uniref:Cytochrome P450 n=1 Tax=Colletotrichum godetiae TaxID=1209918 RepID=A0AAJ0ABH6_9PEZI|nr:uncharacterized protein BDP55DRAFT_677728 [Colletotrichum godetiae]KAK1660095.1 hypothetical protein BDP55DRAFT_677728 [Colletotrichum godetiae]